MPDDWPPSAPKVNKDFKKAHAAASDKAQSNAHPIVTKKEIEDLEKQRKKAAAKLEFTPPGMPSRAALTQEDEKRIAKMKLRIQQAKERTRDDFERSR